MEDYQKLTELAQTWKSYPSKFCKQVLGIEQIWKLQADLLAACPGAIKERKHIYIASGHSLGKDHICGAIALWFLSCYSPSIVVLTAPTERQVEKIMWGEVTRHFTKRTIPIGKDVIGTSPYLEINKNHYLIGFTTKESASSGGGKFQGIHSNSVCVIVSEAQSVDDIIYDQIDAITTAENNLVIFLGNPTRASGRFAEGLRNKTRNIVFNFSCLDNPNYKSRKPIISGLASYEWVEDKRTKWGLDDPRWFGRVLGQIPPQSINSVISREDIEKNLRSKRESLWFAGKRVTSSDFALYGDDETVIYNWVCGNVSGVKILGKSTAPENSANVLSMCLQNESNMFIGDADGLGAPIIDYIELQNKKIEVKRVHGSGACLSDQSDMRFQNMKAEMWFFAQEMLKEGKVTVPDDEMLIQELTEMKYFVNKRGKLQIETKDDLKDRISRSPDRADAWVAGVWAHKFAANYKAKKDAYDFSDKFEQTFNPMVV